MENLWVTSLGSRGSEDSLKRSMKMLNGEQGKPVQHVPDKYITKDISGIPANILNDKEND